MIFNYLTIGQRVRDARRKKRLSQAELAQRVGVTTCYISYIESGYKCMSLETLIRVANALEVTADVFLADCLDKHLVASEAEFSLILEDCSLYESRVILDNARELKRILRENLFTKANRE